MTDIDRLYHKIKDRYSIRRTQVDATVKELEFLVRLLDMMEDDDFGKDNNVPCSGWISVKDRLPEKSGEYFVIKRSGHQDVLAYSARHEAFNAYDIFDKPMHEIKVTYWMPLPERPKEDENG